MNLSDSPGRPACPSRASGWSSLTTPWGLPCCVRFPCVHAVATTPAQRLGVSFAHSPSRISLPRKGCRVGLRIVLFEACSAFTRVTACTLAPSPYFVTASPKASTVSLPPQLLRLHPAGAFRRVGLSPTGKRRLFTAHLDCGHSRTGWTGAHELRPERDGIPRKPSSVSFQILLPWLCRVSGTPAWANPPDIPLWGEIV